MNRIVEYFLTHTSLLNNLLAKNISNHGNNQVNLVRREVRLGHSRIDFLVNHQTFIEVKVDRFLPAEWLFHIIRRCL